MDVTSAAILLAEEGLVASYSYEDRAVYFGRASSTQGTSFRGFREDTVSNVGDAILKLGAPTGLIRYKKKRPHWKLDISIAAVPGPGPEYINENFETLEEAVKAAVECYFGDRINFNNPSLERWFGED